MKKIYYVDLPNPNATGEDDAWVNMDIFFSKKEASQFLVEKYGIDKKYHGLFIATGATE